MTTTAKIGAFFILSLLVIGALVLKIQDIPIGTKARSSTDPPNRALRASA